MDAVNPFTLALPIPSGVGLRLQGVDPQRLAVLYRVERVSTGESVAGVFTGPQIGINAGKVVFETPWFGTYQVIVTERPVVQAREVAVATIETPQPTIVSRQIYWVSGLTLAVDVDEMLSSENPLSWLALGVGASSATPSVLPPHVSATNFDFEK